MIGDSTPDTIVNALRALMANRLDLAFSSTWGQDAVATTIGHPVVRANLPAETLPLLSVVRRSSKNVLAGTRVMLRSQFVIEWYAPQAPTDRVLEFWQALAPVGVEMIRALDGRTYVYTPNPPGADIETVTDVLTAVGVRDIPEESIGFVSNFVQTADTSVFPFVSLTVEITHTLDCLPLHETDGMDNLVALLARWCPTALGAVDAADQPLVSTLTSG
jgi:hypothetical protein